MQKELMVFSRSATVMRALIPLTVAALALTACAPRTEPQPDGEGGANVIEELADGKLDVIVFPMVDEPFVAPNLESGVLPKRGGTEHFQGIDVDIMAAFAGHLGVDVDFVRLDSPGFGDLIPALVAGKGDMIASALTINDDREAIVDFSPPYFSVSIVIITRADSEIASLADLEGKVGVGVRGGLPSETLLAAGFTGELNESEFGTGAYADVSDGIADFAILESASARAGMTSRPGLKIAFAFPDRDEYGFAAREGSRLIKSIGPFLETLESSGELERIITRHLGPDPLDHL